MLGAFLITRDFLGFCPHLEILALLDGTLKPPFSVFGAAVNHCKSRGTWEGAGDGAEGGLAPPAFLAHRVVLVYLVMVSLLNVEDVEPYLAQDEEQNGGNGDLKPNGEVGEEARGKGASLDGVDPDGAIVHCGGSTCLSDVDHEVEKPLPPFLLITLQV